MIYVCYKDAKGEWRWRFEAHNKTIAESAGPYKKIDDLKEDIALLKASSEAELKEASLDKSYSQSVKYISLGLLIVAAILLGLLAFAYGEQNVNGEAIRDFFARRFSTLTARQIAVLLTPIAAGAIARGTHWLDGRYDGGGIRHRVRKSASHVLPDSAAISATMTKQSVLAAIAAILLVIVMTARGPLDPSGSASAITIGFPAFAAELSTIGFLASILLLLVSMKCYDYANRFSLPNEYKQVLIQKGLRLDINSWYLLLFSFAMGVAVISETLSILLTMFGGALLWWYYFIHPEAGATKGAGVQLTQ